MFRDHVVAIVPLLMEPNIKTQKYDTLRLQSLSHQISKDLMY